MLPHSGVVLGVGLFGVAALIVGGLLALVLLGNPPRALTVLIVVRTLSDYAPLGTSVSYLVNQCIVGGAIIGAAVAARGIPGPLRRWERTYVIYLLLGFAVAVISPHFSTDSVNALIRPISYFAIAHIALMAARTRGLQETYRSVVAAGVPAALLVLSGLAHVPGMSSAARPRGTFSQPNVAAAFLMITGILALYLAMENPTGRRIAIAALFPLAVVVTLSADSTIAYIAGVVALLLTSSQFSLFGRSLLVIGGVLGTAVALPFLSVSAKLTNAFSGLNVTNANLGNSNSLQWRIVNWSDLIHLWRSHALFGYGLGSTDSYVQPLHAPPHNEYIRALVENGLVGAVILLCLLVTLLKYVFSHGEGRFPSGARAVVVAVLVNAVAANTIDYTQAMFMFAAIVGASIASVPLADKDLERRGPFGYRPPYRATPYSGGLVGTR